MLHLWSLRPMSLISIFAYFTRSWISSTRYVPTKTKRQRHFFDISIKDNSDLVYHSLRTQTKAASTALQKSWPFKRISNRNAVIIYSLSCHFEPVWMCLMWNTKGTFFFAECTDLSAMYYQRRSTEALMLQKSTIMVSQNGTCDSCTLFQVSKAIL